MRRNLNLAELNNFLEQPILAILATKRKDTSVLLSPVWYEYSDNVITIATFAQSIKSKHIARDPLVTIVVAEQVMPYRGFEARGKAVIITPDNMIDTIRRIAVRYQGAEKGNEFADSCTVQEMRLIRLIPEHIRVWDFADE